MSYIYDPTKDPNQQNPMGAGAPPPTPTGTSGTGTQGTSGAAKPTGSGQFTNLQSYIRANENTDAGKAVGTGVLASPDAAVKESENQVGKLTSMTPGAGPAAMTTADEDWLKSQQPGTGEPDWRGSPQLREKLTGLQTTYGSGPGEYKGPSLDDVNKNIAAAQNAQTTAATQANVLQGANTAGRSELLQSTYGKDKQYSGGENKLDSFLLERNFGSQFDPKFQAVAAQLKAQETAGQAAGDKLTTDIPKIQKDYADSTEKWRTLLGGASETVSAAEQQAATQRVDSQASKNEAIAAAAKQTSQGNADSAEWDRFQAASDNALAAGDYSALSQILKEWQAKHPNIAPTTGDSSITGRL